MHAQQQPKKSNNSNMRGIAEMSNEEMSKRGDHVMGFDHTKTEHHCPMEARIEITANSAEDTESRDQIRAHLAHIAKMFADRDSNAPMLIHDQTLLGVSVMQKLKSEIEYKVRGARARGCGSHFDKESEGVARDHDFLRFQIKEHKT